MLFTKPPSQMTADELSEALEELQPHIHSRIVSAKDDDRVSMRLEQAASRVGSSARNAVSAMGAEYGMD